MMYNCQNILQAKGKGSIDVEANVNVAPVALKDVFMVCSMCPKESFVGPRSS